MNSDLEEHGFGRPGDLILQFCREVTVQDGEKHFVLRHCFCLFPTLLRTVVAFCVTAHDHDSRTLGRSVLQYRCGDVRLEEKEEYEHARGCEGFGGGCEGEKGPAGSLS